MAKPAAAPVLMWFRRDLRLADNPALLAAAATAAPVIPLFVLDEGEEMRQRGGASLWWLDKSLRALAAILEARGSRLVLRRGDARDIVPALAAKLGAQAVVWNRLYEPDSRARDATVEAALTAAGVRVETHNAWALNEPGTVKTGGGRTYKVFGAYWKAARALLHDVQPEPAPEALLAPGRWPMSDEIRDWGLHPTKPDWSTGLGDWTPGEAGAQARLAAFLGEEGLFGDYQRARDRPNEDGSTRLSPHLHWGEIGPRQLFRAVCDTAADRGLEAQREKLLSELAWRDFNTQLLWAEPTMAEKPIRPAFERLAVRRDAKGLSAWQRGQTGYPVVDAGMRQLWVTGWMHNRVRLIAASFLVKHLLLDWRQGEAWFWDTLVDADWANNAANWQWIAGSGVDASPFFRIFNPVAQGEKFDQAGDYVRRWVPELAKLPAKVIHRPWEADAPTLKAAGVILGRDYPRPVVDHAKARARALGALRAMREEAQAAETA